MKGIPLGAEINGLVIKLVEGYMVVEPGQRIRFGQSGHQHIFHQELLLVQGCCLQILNDTPPVLDDDSGHQSAHQQEQRDGNQVEGVQILPEPGIRPVQEQQRCSLKSGGEPGDVRPEEDGGGHNREKHSGGNNPNITI
ncbi:hypothetical protein D3C75_498760 [compost metagenome]